MPTVSSIVADLLASTSSAGCRAVLGTALFSDTVPSNAVGANDDFAVVGPSGIIYKKIAGVWTAYAAGTLPTFYAVTDVPAFSFGNNGDTAIVYSGGNATLLLEKVAGSWVTRGAFASPEGGLTLPQVHASIKAKRLQSWRPILTGTFAGTGQGTLINQGLGAQISAGSTVSSYGRALMSSFLTGPSGGTGVGINFSVPIAVEVALSGDVLANASGGKLRIVVGEAGSGAPIAGDLNALTSRGFGVEFAWNVDKVDARLFAHNGTSYVTGAWLGTAALSALLMTSVRIESDGAGNISGYLAKSVATNGGAPLLPASASFPVLAGGPTGNGTSVLQSASILAVGHTTTPPTAAADCIARIHNTFIEITGS